MTFQYTGGSLVVGMSIATWIGWMLLIIFDGLSVYSWMLIGVLIVSIIFART
jgi:hypothetical protein